ncbi:extracellular solute-binding protein [Blastococcus saxobsidens]|uniref:ABC transporter substrate-binding protein n=1 Tax=Blastococcus saxobsidens (strain DD2) TaxID=1146883 RepID=H6RNH8_BLASD|nr:extracellular solute-binding protein [Blastococcus saxobsidens]CCG03925.1 ABC transporter substrate-binding protein [Blastococcus saxobsidens DD2]
MRTGPLDRPAGHAARRRGRRTCALLSAALLALAACGGEGGEGSEAETGTAGPITLYTCVSDTTIQPVIDAFESRADGAQVELFRAPTGELNARVAADARSGGLRADVIWGCDPLTMQGFVDQGLVGGWTPPEAAAVPGDFRTEDYVGVHVLYMLAVHRTDAPAPEAWSDLATGGHAVAVPDPSVAASALGALGWFAEEPGYGVDFYADLERNGAVQVSTPNDVTTGVAQGIYDAGITHANSAYAALEDGSPIEVVWPDPGAVAIHGPIALATDSADSEAAKDFISFVVGEEGQAVVGESGSYPTRPGAPTPTIPANAPIVFPDWAAIGDDKDAILSEYQQVFGG